MWTALANREIRRLEIAWAVAWIAIWGWLAALGVVPLDDLLIGAGRRSSGLAAPLVRPWAASGG